jgi:hypothetical protein
MEIRGDQIRAAEILEKTRWLQTGATILDDQAHEFGIDAFPALPEGRTDEHARHGTGDSILATSTEIDATEEEAPSHDAFAALAHRIQRLKIPAIVRTRAIRFLVFFIVLVAPMVGFLIFSTNVLGDMTQPLPYIRDLSLSRVGVYQMAAFSLRYLKEQTNQTRFINHALDLPVHLGGTWSTKLQVICIMSMTTAAMQNVVGLRHIETSYDELNQVRALVFTDTFNYTTFTHEPNGVNESMTIENAIVDFVLRLAPLATQDEFKLSPWADAPWDRAITPKFFTDAIVLNIVKNLGTMVNRLDKSTEFACRYIEALERTTDCERGNISLPHVAAEAGRFTAF